jgi:hypothetical protein
VSSLSSSCPTSPPTSAKYGSTSPKAEYPSTRASVADGVIGLVAADAPLPVSAKCRGAPGEASDWPDLRSHARRHDRPMLGIADWLLITLPLWALGVIH